MEDPATPLILIADDDTANIGALTEILGRKYKLLSADTCARALEVAVNERPCLILLNTLLSGASGYDILPKLGEIDATRYIPVLMITDPIDVSSEARGLLLGAAGYIVKPFDRELIRARVDAHVRVIKYIREVERLSMIDALTDIPNRRSFDVTVNEEWRRMFRNRSPISLLMIDVDNFKDYNDTYGHPQGDILLKYLSHTFTKCLRRPYDTAARIGGEEFAIILPSTDLIGAMGVAESIRAAVEAMRVPCANLGTDTFVTVSIGVAAMTPNEHHIIGDLIEQADRNLYSAKTAGRNRIFA
ncbi:MAG: diguanylate cyclase [Oscillospiraceae bacterium]|jgi:diguanylate cyclase (GGDEF)-like protein|nr:diguanylate cyclase [Oscillospiraceae bacterium]